MMTLWLILYILTTVESKGNQQWTVNISDSNVNDFYYYWDKAVGSGHAALLLRTDWRQLMKNGHDKLNFSMVRCHAILDDDVGSVNGINDYSFVNIDKIYSYLLSIGMKPYVEISYMPCEYFATNPNQTRNQYQWCGSPPKSYNIWYSFIQQFVQHLVDYFGANEVRQWQFEVWNEPDGTYANGDYSEYIKLYNSTANAIKAVDKTLMVGGPTTTNFNWLNRFLEDIISNNIPIDFVATHSYPNQLKIKNINSWVNEIQTNGINVVDQINAKYNLSLPLVISEYNSGCCMTPFGKFMNDDNYYAGAFLIFWAKHLQSLFPKGSQSTLKWLSYWAISDVFDENDFNSHEFNNLYGLQTIRGIAKPAFRAFELLYQYGSNIEYKSTLLYDDNDFSISNSTLQVYCLKNGYNKNRYSVFIANWNNYGMNIGVQNVSVNVGNYVENTNDLKSVTMYRIDANNTAPLSAWIAMGSPEYPTEQQLVNLNVSSQLNAMEINHKIVDQNTIQFELDMPIYSAVLLDLQY
eukprot:27843_1